MLIRHTTPNIVCFATALVASVLLSCSAKASNGDGSMRVSYGYSYNGKEMDRSDLTMYVKDQHVGFAGSDAEDELNAAVEQMFIDQSQKLTYQLLTLKDGRRFYKKTSFSALEPANPATETMEILGYECSKATLKIRSNRVEIWYTNALGVKGSPRITIAPGIGLVLRILINGNYEIVAKNIDFASVDDDQVTFDLSISAEVNASVYERKLIESRYTSIPVFEHERVNFEELEKQPMPDREGMTYRYSKGTVIVKKVKLPDARQRANVFAELTTWSAGDAYDRVGSLFIIPTERTQSFLNALRHGIDQVPAYTDHRGEEYQGVMATDNYLPPLELIRFFTPFGVGHFNDQVQIDGFPWADSVIYRREVTELLPYHAEEIWIGVFISNYDKGGHMINLNLKCYPFSGTDAPGDDRWIMPLFNTVNIMEAAGQNYGTMFHGDSLTVEFEIPEGLEQLKLIYTSTGHGGWSGGDAFNRKINDLFIDDEKIYSFVPWRDDCATYRLLNPSSGNFDNGMSSSDYSRSNWCPGTLTVPEDVPLDQMSPGKHTLKIAIPIGPREGNSFSAWNVSGILVGKFEQ